MNRVSKLRARVVLTSIVCCAFGTPGLVQQSWAAETAPPALPASLSPAPHALPPVTLSALQKLLAAPELADARLGISIVALGKVDAPDQFPARAYADASHPVLFEQDADKRFMPASNMKLYTAALALDRLGAGKRFITGLTTLHQVKNGELMGPLELLGDGDPSLDIDGLRSLAKAVAKSGIRKVRGLVTIEAGQSGLQGENLGGRYPDGWTLDDALWYYGPEVTSLTFHRNQLDVIVTGGAREGDPATVQLEAGFPDFKLGRDIFAKITTGGADLAAQDGEDLLLVDRAIGAQTNGKITVSGKVAPGKQVVVGIAVPNPSKWALQVFRRELEAAGVKVVNTPADPRQMIKTTLLPDFLTKPLATFPSPPVGELLKRFLKNSDNLYGELLWRQAGLNNQRTAPAARQAMQAFTGRIGIDPSSLKFSDGSGLSRYNLVTPRATTQLLAAVEKLRGGENLWASLPIAGVDGTLRKRMIGTAAVGNVRAKTGTFSIVSCLSGYVTTKDGQRLAVSVLTNFARNGNDARYLQNNIFVVLANADFGG